MPSALSERKQAMRRIKREARLSAAQNNSNAANMLCDVFKLNIKLEHAAVVAGYRAFRGEMDPAPLMQHLRSTGHPIALPVVTGKNLPLTFRLYDGHGPLSVNPMGIEEPPAAWPDVDPDILLVPLLAFDRNRNRLGYGGGFYDRTMTELRRRKPILAIGIGYSFQQVDDVPAGGHDAILDKIVTENRVL